jgi:hypothetical protein
MSVRRYKPLPKEAIKMSKEEQEEKKGVKPIPTEEQAIAASSAATATGGYKKNYTVKELKSIATRNNIKTTKKLDGKTVNLNKKGLMTKLKRKKMI